MAVILVFSISYGVAVGDPGPSGPVVNITASAAMGPLVTTSATPNEDPPVSLVGNVIRGSVPISDRGFVWSLYSYDDPGNIPPEATDYSFLWIESGSFALGEFLHRPADLMFDTDYFGRAVVKGNDKVWVYGNEIVFDPISGILGNTIGDFILSNLLPVIVAMAVAIMSLVTILRGAGKVGMLVSILLGVMAYFIVNALVTTIFG